jgi:hypothetical protein
MGVKCGSYGMQCEEMFLARITLFKSVTGEAAIAPVFPGRKYLF